MSLSDNLDLREPAYKRRHTTTAMLLPRHFLAAHSSQTTLSPGSRISV